MILSDLAPGHGEDLNLALGLAALPSDGLATPRRQRAKEVVKGRVAAIFPMILAALAQGEALLAHPRPLLLGRKIHVEG